MLALPLLRRFLYVLVLYFLARAASSFSAVIFVCISGSGVVRWWSTLAFRRRMISEDSMCTAAREASSAAASYSSEKRAAASGVLHTLQTDIQWSGNKTAILYQSEHQKIPIQPKQPRLKNLFFSFRNSIYLLAATVNTKCDISGIPTMRPTEHPRTSPPGSTGSERVSLYSSFIHLPESSL